MRQYYQSHRGRLRNHLNIDMRIFGKFNLIEQLDVERAELKRFSRSFAELEWLLMVLVLLYTVAPGVYLEDQWIILKCSLVFAGLILAFRYLSYYQYDTRWKLAMEAWVMIAYITCVLWYTGKIDSPLLNLYLLVIITSGLALGKFITLVTLAMITVLYIYMGVPVVTRGAYTLEHFTHIMTVFSPYLIVAYLTTMLSADLQFARKMFKHLSETDDMTDLMNRRSFSDAITSEHNKSFRYGRVYSILAVDADGLKTVNDDLGHKAGDKLIITLAKTIEDCLRESDSLARLGGDEFIVLLPETNKKQAEDTGERIRKAVENTSFDMHGTLVKATVSIGVSSYPEDAKAVDDLLTSADKALYKSKQGGRNRVSVTG